VKKNKQQLKQNAPDITHLAPTSRFVAQKMHSFVGHPLESSSVGRIVGEWHTQFAEMPKRAVIKFVTDTILFNKALKPAELHAVYCAEFKNQEHQIPVVPVIQSKSDDECELLLMNITNRARRVLFGEFLSDPIVITYCMDVMCKDGPLDLYIAHHAGEIVGPRIMVRPHEIVSVPFDADFVPREDLRSGMVDIAMKMNVDGEEYSASTGYLLSR